jgi:pimeloyl-ACP methyl ester carboxylesterase
MRYPNGGRAAGGESLVFDDATFVRDAPMTEFPNPLGGERKRYRWRDHDVAYVQRGSGPALLLVHAIHACAWSMEWREVVPALSARFTTYSLDFLGFGASAHPALRFSAEMYIELIRDFLTDVVREPAVLVGSSLGGTYVVSVAAQHPALARAVCAIGPAGVSRLTIPGGTAGTIVQALFRSEFPGAALFSLLVSKPSIRFFLKKTYFDKPRMLTSEVVNLYWVSAAQHNARFGPAAFVGMRLNHDIRKALVAMPCPFLLVWGEHAVQTPFRESAEVHALRPQSPFAVLPGGDLPHEESPAAFVGALFGFLDAAA